MPAFVPMAGDEREALLAFLEQQRHVVRVAAHGLTDAQARATPTASRLSIGGLVRHLASAEGRWTDVVFERYTSRDRSLFDAEFTLEDGDTLAAALDRYAAAAAATDAMVRGVGDLSQPAPVPRGAPWFPSDIEAWSVRWVVLHLIEETARHAGHADIIRETLDGATAGPLMAAAEGWPPDGLVRPWQPAP